MEIETFKANVNGFIADMEDFIVSKQSDPPFTFWKRYIDMVQLLLLFILAEREGNWNLHLETMRDMPAWMSIHDHMNHARWGIVYSVDMLQLEKSAPDVYEKLMGHLTKSIQIWL